MYEGDKLLCSEEKSPEEKNINKIVLKMVRLWGLFIALIARTTSLIFILDSQRKYFVSVDIGNVPRYKILFSKRGEIGYVTRAVKKPLSSLKTLFSIIFLFYKMLFNFFIIKPTAM